MASVLHDVTKMREQYADDIIGDIFFWSLTGEAQLERDPLVDAAKKHDIPSKFLPSPLSKTRAFKRAVAKVRHDNPDFVLEQVRDDPSSKGIGLVVIYPKAQLRDPEVADKLQGAIEQATATIGGQEGEAAEAGLLKKIERETGLTGEGYFLIDKGEKIVIPSAGPLQAQFIEAYGKYGGYYTANDIRKIMIDLVNRLAGGVRLRRSGGIYYVPQYSTETLDQICGFLTDICAESGVGFSPFRCPVLKNSESVEMAQTALEDSILGALDAFLPVGEDQEGKLDVLETQLKDGMTIRPSTFEKHVKEVRRVMEQAELAQDLLNFTIEDLHERVNGIMAKYDTLKTHVEETAAKVAEAIEAGDDPADTEDAA